MTAVQFIIGFLRSHGVKTVFGYPGANILPLYDAIAASDIELVVTRHEQGAVHAAAGYAKASGKVGVCIATSGPGATNLLTGIADASLDSTPLLAITGQVRREFVGRDAFQEADILGVSMPLTKHNTLVRRAEDLVPSLEECWDIAVSGRCGPVLIDVTSDILAGRLPDSETAESARDTAVVPGVYDSDVEALRDIFAHSYRPLILAGGGVIASGAVAALRRLVKKTGIPAALTMTALGVDFGAPESSRLTLGMAGVYGTSAANAALERCDLLIAVGCRFSDRTVGDFTITGRGRTIVHADIDVAEISKNVRADLGITADAGDFIRALEELSAESFVMRDYSGWHDEITAAAGSDWDKPPIFDALSLPRTLYVTDVGCSQTDAAEFLRPCFERGFVTSAGLGAMGFGLPAAVGAAFAARDFELPVDRVVLICGDGGFQMTLHELSTLKKSPLPVKVVIFDNSRLAMVENLPHTQPSSSLAASYELDNPDFAKLAEAYGIESARYSPDFDCDILLNDKNAVIIYRQ